ncbi:MAG: hypothetical protein IT442_06385 [Phycisphaeraceae bacterium]|nr:hypothetical protein [Phycisphaeraceae bacterium]
MADEPSKADQDLSQQLDDLLAEIEHQEPGFAQAAGLGMKGEEPSRPADEPAAPVRPEPTPMNVEATPAPGASPAPATAAEKPADDLDAQIQELLDGAKALEDAAPVRAAPTPAAGAASAKEAAAARPADAEAFPTEAAAQGIAQDEQATEAPAARAAASAADPGLMQQIDELLASEADKAVAGEFETVDDVLGDEQVAAATPIPPAPTPDEAPGSAEAGAGQTPAGGATAKDVAAELDQDLVSAAPASEQDTPAAEKRAGKTPEAAAAAEGNAEPTSEAAVAEQEEMLPAGEPVIRRGALLQFCTAVNAPVRKLSPPSRRIVGYVALLTLFNGSAFTIMALLRSMFGH